MIDDDDEGRKQSDREVVYKWEQGVSSFAAVLGEDLSAEGQLALQRQKLQKAKERRITPAVRRGLLRYLFCAIDCSLTANERDFRPTRLQVCKENIKKFIIDYYDQNPISQLGKL